MGYCYAVLGAGRQGTAAAYDMGKFGEAGRVLIGDADEAAARRRPSWTAASWSKKVGGKRKTFYRKIHDYGEYINVEVYQKKSEETGGEVRRKPTAYGQGNRLSGTILNV